MFSFSKFLYHFSLNHHTRFINYYHSNQLYRHFIKSLQCNSNIKKDYQNQYNGTLLPYELYYVLYPDNISHIHKVGNGWNHVDNIHYEGVKKNYINFQSISTLIHHLHEWIHTQPGKQLIITPTNDIHIQDLIIQNTDIGFHFRIPALEAPILNQFLNYIQSIPELNNAKTYSQNEFIELFQHHFAQFEDRSKATLNQLILSRQTKILINEYYHPHSLTFKDHFNHLRSWLQVNALSIYHPPQKVMISDFKTAQPDQYDHCYVIHPEKMPSQFINHIIQHPDISFSGVNCSEFHNHFKSTDQASSIEYHQTPTHTVKPKKAIHHHSITSLKHHNLCPMIHLCQHQLKIRKENTHSLMLDRGIIIHNALEQLWQQLEKQEHLIHLSIKQRSNMIDHILEEMISSYNKTCEWEYAHWSDEKHFIKSLIERWLDFETTRSKFKVMHLEKKVEYHIGDQIISGRVDRIDYVFEQDSHLLIDYKLNNTPTIKELMSGLPDPQLAIYALASPVPLYGLAYGLIKDARFKGIAYTENNEHLGVIQKPDWHEAIKTTLSNINKPPDGKPYYKNQCAHCDWRSICRYQEKICEDT